MKNVSLLLFAALAGSTLAAGTSRAQETTTRDTLTLAQAVQLSIRNSPAIMQGEAAIDAARARTGTIEANEKPQLEGSANYTRIDPTITVDFPVGGKVQQFSFSPNDNYSASVTLQQNIYDFGRLGAQVDVAHSNEKTAQDNLAQYQTLTAYQTVQAYYGLLSTDESLRVEEEQLRVLRASLGISEERERAGTETTLGPLNVQVRLSSLESGIANLQSARMKQEAVLRRLTGLPPMTAIVIAPPARAFTLPASLDSLQSLAALHRSELVVAKDQENTALLQVTAARKGDNPTLAANVMAGVKDGYPPDLTKPVPNWAGTIALRVPILDGGRTRSQVDEAEANYRSAQARTLDIQRQIESEIEQAMADVQANRARLGLVTTQIAEAQQAYDITLTRYKNGAATNLDLLTAQSNVEQANLQRAQLTYQLELSQYNLGRAVGETIW